MSRVLVTGASGFVGQALCPALNAAGHEPVPVVRQSISVDNRAAAAQRMIAEIGPDTDWRDALDGIDAVIHLAARVHVGGESGADALAHHRRVNLGGTRRLAEAAAAAGVRRFVFLSTVKVMGERTADHPFFETDRPQPEDAYAISKWEAEQALADIAQGTALEPVVLRPPLVYGPGVKANFRALMDAVRRGLPLPLAGIASRRSLLYLGNLIDGIIQSLEQPAAAGQTFLMRDGEDVSIAELIRQLAQAMGRPARLFYLPPGLLRTASALTGQGDSLRRLVDGLAVDDDKIRRSLGWAPPYSLEQGLAETVAWFQGEHDRGKGTKHNNAV
jgi:nucleoside-diphosphate-sugar epimerase